MAWLVRDEDVLASLDVADSFKTRLKGLLGRDGIDGAMLIRPAKSVHTLRMKFPIDVAFCSKDLQVLDTITAKPNRLVFSSHLIRAHCVIEAEAGAFERWQLKRGDQLEIRE